LVKSLRTIADYIRYCFSSMNKEAAFCGHGFDNAWDESVGLVLQVLDLPWDFDREMWSCRVSKEERALLASAIERRVNERVPTAYITSKAFFCGLPFYVDDRVLVPRSPISELIERGFAPWLIEAPRRVMDLCTGSACIGIACAYAFPESQIDCLDISSDAIAVACTNVEKHAVGDQVTLYQSDVFDALPQEWYGTYDLIVSNPPYVDQQDIDSMPVEYHKEPMLGLASGEDGLDITRRILRQAAKWLSSTGVLIVEVGNSWEALEEAYPDVSFTWLEFERGGHGVFMLAAAELQSREW
jgi:ribosomal protein L3 glutamine methyltransferase